MSNTSLTFLLLGVALLWSAAAIKLAEASPECRVTNRRATDTPPPEDVWQEQPVRDLTTAEALLDRLEAAGFADREFLVHPDGTFAVRWRRGSVQTP